MGDFTFFVLASILYGLFGVALFYALLALVELISFKRRMRQIRKMEERDKLRYTRF